MPRAEKSAAVIENENETEGTEEHNAPASASNKTPFEVIQEPTGDADSDGVGESGEDGEALEDESGSGSQEDGVSEPDSKSEIATLKAELAELRKDRTEPKKQEYSDEDYARAEKALGIPKAAIQFYTKQMAYMRQSILDAMEEKMGQYVGDLRRDSTVRRLSMDPRFKDAGKYRKDIDGFMAKYHPREAGNMELAEMAYHYAKGKSLNADTARANAGRERNLKIAGSARPASPGSSQPKPRATLSAMGKKIADEFGMEHDEAVKWKGKVVFK